MRDDTQEGKPHLFRSPRTVQRGKLESWAPSPLDSGEGERPDLGLRPETVKGGDRRGPRGNAGDTSHRARTLGA